MSNRPALTILATLSVLMLTGATAVFAQHGPARQGEPRGRPQGPQTMGQNEANNTELIRQMQEEMLLLRCQVEALTKMMESRMNNEPAPQVMHHNKAENNQGECKANAQTPMMPPPPPSVFDGPRGQMMPPPPIGLDGPHGSMMPPTVGFCCPHGPMMSPNVGFGYPHGQMMPPNVGFGRQHSPMMQNRGWLNGSENPRQSNVGGQFGFRSGPKLENGMSKDTSAQVRELLIEAKKLLEKAEQLQNRK